MVAAIATAGRGGTVADATIADPAVTVASADRGVSARAAGMKALRLSLLRRS
jgi:hypothetical protein